MPLLLLPFIMFYFLKNTRNRVHIPRIAQIQKLHKRVAPRLANQPALMTSSPSEYLRRSDGTLYYNSPSRDFLRDRFNKATLNAEQVLLEQAIVLADRERAALFQVQQAKKAKALLVAEENEQTKKRLNTIFESVKSTTVRPEELFLLHSIHEYMLHLNLKAENPEQPPIHFVYLP